MDTDSIVESGWAEDYDGGRAVTSVGTTGDGRLLLSVDTLRRGPGGGYAPVRRGPVEGTQG